MFGSLKQRVIWNYDEEFIEGLPPNVLLKKWLPQRDLIGKKLLFSLFFTVNSTVYCVYSNSKNYNFFVY